MLFTAKIAFAKPSRLQFYLRDSFARNFIATYSTAEQLNMDILDTILILMKNWGSGWR